MRFLILILLAGCTPDGGTPGDTIEGTFGGESVELAGVTMFHWRSGLTDDEGNAIDAGRLALSFSETDGLCDRQRGFLADASDQGVPLPVDATTYDDHVALFEEHFPVVDSWDITFWLGLPEGTEEADAVDVPLAASFDDTYLNAEAVAVRWDRVPPGDLLTWRSDEWYGEYGATWTSVSGSVALDTFVAGEQATGSIQAVFEDAQGETAEIDVTFDVDACFSSAG